MSWEFDSRKDSHTTKFNWRPEIFIKLSFRELCDSKLSGLHLLYNMVIIHWVKKTSKTECRLRVIKKPILDIIFVTLTGNWSVMWHPATMEIFTSPEIAVGTHNHPQHGTKNTPLSLPADGQASWWLLPSSASLLSGRRVQLENTYSCILMVTS